MEKHKTKISYFMEFQKMIFYKNLKIRNFIIYGNHKTEIAYFMEFQKTKKYKLVFKHSSQRSQ
jgi:hypothetical protein